VFLLPARPEQVVGAAGQSEHALGAVQQDARDIQVVRDMRPKASMSNS
jgi:hypothetical protein